MIQNQLTESKRIFGLDIMRALAILMVLSSHCLWIYPENNSFLASVLHLFGYLGVEIFFVLSGFLIGKILYELYQKPDFSFSDIKYFLKRRWFRTFPNYFLILIVNIAIAAIIGYKVDFIWKYFLFIQNFSKEMPSFFPESWSLSVEEWAYFLLPFCLLLFRKVHKNKSLTFLIIVLILISIFQILKIVYHLNSDYKTLQEWNLHLKPIVIYRLDAILYGVLASWIYLNFISLWQKYQFISLIVSFVIMFFLHFRIPIFSFTEKDWILFYNVYYMPLVSIAIALCLPFLSNWKNEKSFLKKPVTAISLISYSIYILHYSVILQLMKYFFFSEKWSLMQRHIFTIIYLTITISVSFLFYKFFEKPMTNLRNRGSHKS